MRRLCIVMFALAMVGLTGCPGKFTGGGWIDSTEGAPDKAHVGFNVHAADTDGDGFADTYKGQWQFHDKAAGVSFHGVITYVESFDDGSAYVFGEYTPQPKNAGAGGFFDSFIYDLGKPGDLDPDDFFDVYVYSGLYAGYYNAGYIQGGNIKYHPPE